MHAHAAANGARDSRRRVAAATWSSSSSSVLDEKVYVTAPAATANKVETGDDAPAPDAGRAASEQELTTSCWLFSSLATAPRIITKSLSDAHLADSMTTASKAMSVLHHESVPKPSHSEGHVSDSSLSSVGESRPQQTLELTVYNGRSSSNKEWCATDASSDDSSLYTVDEDGFHADGAHVSRDEVDEAVDELVHCATLQNEQLRMMTSGYVHRRMELQKQTEFLLQEALTEAHNDMTILQEAVQQALRQQARTEQSLKNEMDLAMLIRRRCREAEEGRREVMTQVESLKEGLTAAHATAAKAEEEAEQMRARVKAGQKEVDTANLMREQVEVRELQACSDLSAALKERDALKCALEHSDENFTELRNKMHESEAQLAASKEEACKLVDEAARQQAHAASLTQQIGRAESIASVARQRTAEVEAQLSAERQQTESQQHELVQMQRAHRTLTEESFNQSVQLESTGLALSVTANQLKAVQDQEAELRRSLQSAETAQAATSRQLEATHMELRAAEVSVVKLQVELRANQRQRAAQAGEVESLQRALQSTLTRVEEVETTARAREAAFDDERRAASARMDEAQANLAEQKTTNRQLRGEEEALRLCSLEQLRALLAALELGGTRVRSALLSGEVAAKARAEAEEAAVCGVCLHRPRDTALNCGHLTCDRCAPRLASCPICRTPISNRTRVFI